MDRDNHFTPLTGCSHPHLQTLLPRFLRRQPLFTPRNQRLVTPDGDFIDLAWTTNNAEKHAPLFVLFHGLEGCFHSPYANGLLHSAAQQGWLGVMMHFRGCSGEPNRYAASYHSGHTHDARYVLQWLQRHHPQRQIIAVGISLGGNMLANYLAQYRQDTKICAAQIVSAPLQLASCAKRIQQGFSKIYQAYLLNSLKKRAAKKQQAFPAQFVLDSQQILNISNLYQFDDVVTAPLNGFKDAQDYYAKCSALPRLSDITIPCRFIHAIDDPFMDKSVIPARETLPDNIHYDLLDRGGHVGFVGGTLRAPHFWLEQTVPSWFQAALCEKLR
ncbi:hydrolase [Thaumasiovibrio subtropicus]|uniref:hydrolase n=1 Tax=Thaumasiovibrio subtropicus TaxID=1891207 RepID=UPI000B34D3BB|nr:hydrolase [Thaumasiovibrio subtropicus]